MNHANDNGRPISFISMFSGIEAASVAFGPLGWKPICFAEIEKFPSAVLAHHYPDVPNVGDMSKHDWSQYSGKVDIVCGGPPCFTAGHMVLSSKGYVPIESINVGDSVVTHKGRLRTVLRIGNERKEVGTLAGVGICEPITCTADHPFLAVDWRNQNTKRKNLYAKVEHCGDPKWVAANDMPGRQWCQLTTHDNDNRAPESTKFDVKTAMYIAGVYLGDGWIRKHAGKNKKSVVLGINPEKYKKLQAVIGNVVHTVGQERTTVRVSIHDTVFADWLEGEFAHYSHLKTIPSWVLGHDFRAEFLRGFLDADGHVNANGKVSISTTSRSLAYGVSDLMAAEGYVSSVTFVGTPDTCVIEGRTCNQKDYYQVRGYPLSTSRKARVRHGMVLRKVSSFTPSGEDTVFNIEVDGDNSYIVQGAIVHNCQDFSIAGLRAGLDGARGNLSITYMRALHAIKPRNAIVENVPGWLNDKKNAFGCFLAGLVGADDPLRTPDGKSWPNAGMVAGPLGRAAWRVLDAQYFGLAQRRRRVIVVADFGNGADPSAVLFERKSLLGNITPSREAGKDVAPTISARTKGGGGLGTDFDLDGGLRVDSAYAIQERAVSLNLDAGPQGKGYQPDIAYTLEARNKVQSVAYAPEIARCVATREGSSQDYESTTMVAQAIQAIGVTGQTSHAPIAEGSDASEDGIGLGTPVVCVTPIDMRQASRGATMTNNRKEGSSGGAPGTGIGEEGDPSPTISTSHPPAICFTAKDYVADASFDLAPTLRAGGFTGSHANGGVMPAVAMTVAIRGRDGGAMAELGGEVATALRASQGGGDKPHVLTAVAFAENSRAEVVLSGGDCQTVSTLKTGVGKAGQSYAAAMVGSAVRRLTPRECERLQGFQWLCSPDYPGAWQDEAGRWWSPDYTLIPYGNKLKGEVKGELAAYFEKTGQYMREVSEGELVFDREDFEKAWPRISADGPRYKALGNSWAVPKFTWLGRRIAQFMPQAADNDNHASTPISANRSHA